MRKIYLLLLVGVFTEGISQTTTSEVKINDIITGTLWKNPKAKPTTLVILFSGSGPTDRNGNQPSLENNSLKFLAEGMAEAGNAVYSFDKRIIAQIKSGNIEEEKMSFDDLVNDGKSVLAHFRMSKKYKKIILAGHSEGALIASLIPDADAYISICGASRPADALLVEQISRQAPYLKEEVEKNFATLRKGETFKLENPVLGAIFRESVQPYLISWIKYDPSAEIAKIKKPVLVIGGTKDLQVPESEAETLHKANPKSKLVIVPDLNHVLKEISGPEQQNSASYSDPEIPVSPALLAAVNQFTKTI